MEKNRVHYEYYHLGMTENVPEDYTEIFFVCLREETSGKGTNAGRVAAAAAAGAVVVGGGGAAVYVTMIKGKFKFK